MHFDVLPQAFRRTFNWLRGQLWFRPLLICGFSLVAVFVATLADGSKLADRMPGPSPESVRDLLNVMSGSMLVIATFAVGSMVAAYASASNNTTPRSFPLVLADDLSQNAMSTFIGAFIYSVVAQSALKNEAYGPSGRLVLFFITVAVFAAVVLMLIAWVDRIARLGRLGDVMQKAEAAAADALKRRAQAPWMQAAPPSNTAEDRDEVFAECPGHVRDIDIAALHSWAEQHGARVRVMAEPGTFVAGHRALARVMLDAPGEHVVDLDGVRRAFDIGDARSYDNDPRFGLIVLSEIASRALSPAVNDPGSAIAVLGAQARLLTVYARQSAQQSPESPRYPRVHMSPLDWDDLCEDAFAAIARDGAGCIEVAMRLQKVLSALACADCEGLRLAARRHSLLAFKRAEIALKLPQDLERLRGVVAGEASKLG